MSQIPGLGRFPREGNGNPLQYSCLGNPMDRGGWWAMVCGFTKIWTQLSDFTLRKYHRPYPRGTRCLLLLSLLFSNEVMFVL